MPVPSATRFEEQPKLPAKFSVLKTIHVRDVAERRTDEIARQRAIAMEQIAPQICRAIANRGPLVVDIREELTPGHSPYPFFQLTLRATIRKIEK